MTMNKVNAILQVRSSSSRLPNKAMMSILGQPMLFRQIERIQRSQEIDRLIVATSHHPSDDAIETLCHKLSIDCFRGDLDDVLGRFYQTSKIYPSQHIVRLTGDCPLTDPKLIDDIINLHLQEDNDYTSNTLDPTYPDGLDIEIFKSNCLEQADQEAYSITDREHVTPFIYNNPHRFKIYNFTSPFNFSHLRWTVDHIEDFKLIARIYELLYNTNHNFTTQHILELFQSLPELESYNSHFIRNEGLQQAIVQDENHSFRYKESEALLARALQVIPLGSQTFSKSKTQYPYGVSPYFISRGVGSHVWDVDDNQYIDFVNALASITLGYGDSDVTEAVQKQLKQGTIFSLSHPIEIEVAEKIIEFVPCAEMVRFAKNGSDATSGAIRLARAYTGRDRIAVCGYHGWQDWYIGITSRDLGVPKLVKSLTHTFLYNDLDSLKSLLNQYPGEFAAVILEPMNICYPNPGFLEELRTLTQKIGTLLIFDETITGFRYALGGAQEYFGVSPDLATLGKGIANGYPLSAIVGRTDIMMMMEDIFFSSTFGGETLSLAAALATLNKLQSHSVINILIDQGQKIIDGVNRLVQKHKSQDFISISGHPTWSFIILKGSASYSQEQIKTLFLQEVFSRGILTLGTHNLSYAHTDRDIEKLLNVYDEVFAILKLAIDHKNLESILRCDPLTPLFKVR